MATRLGPPLRVDRLVTGERQLVRPLVIATDVVGDPVARRYPQYVGGSPLVVVVPAGFVTDFSSIPALFRPLFRFSAVDLAGCVHDLAYRVQLDRKTADKLWRNVAGSGHPRNRLGRFRSWLGYVGLRLGGRRAYCNNAVKSMFVSAGTIQNLLDVAEVSLWSEEDEMAAGSHDFDPVEQGATFYEPVTWRDSDGDVVDLTTYTARMQVRETKDAADFLIELNTENSRITLSSTAPNILLEIDAADTKELAAGSYKYDLELESASGFVTRLLEGKFKVDAEVTREDDEE